MNFKKIVLTVGFIVVSGPVVAEFNYSNSSVADATATARENAKRQLHQESVVGVTSAVNQSAQFDKSKLLRCWQEGELIVAENHWELKDPSAGVLMTQNGKKMSVFQFGETFCMYLGD